MDIRQLQYFLKVVECGSITLAATRLGLAQPTLTKSLAQLEREFGTALLRRLPRGVEPTEAGLRLARHGRSIELQLREARREIETFGSEPAGVVAIGAGPAWLRRLLPEALVQALRTYPDLRARVAGGFDESLLRDLRAGTLDFIVAELPQEAPDLAVTPLVADDLGVVARAGHPLLGRPLQLHDLAGWPWAMPPASTRAQQRLGAFFVAAGLPAPLIRIETASMAFLLNAVRLSDCLTLTVRTTLEAPDAGGLAWLDIPGLKARREAGVLMRRDTFVTPAMRAVIDVLVGLCAADPRN